MFDFNRKSDGNKNADDGVVFLNPSTGEVVPSGW
jgi:hypothetical protein